MNKAPIVIFAFNRPDSLSRLIQSLKNNVGFENRETYIYIDGPRNCNDKPKINEVYSIAQSFSDNVYKSDKNNGLGPSIINGVTQVLKKYDKAIVLEDDLVLMPGFLNYMDAALDKYEHNNNIFSICGYGLKIKCPIDYQGDVYLSNRASSWGWATWRDRWNSVDWEVRDWEELKKRPELKKAFNQGGSDMYGMLKGYMEGRNRSWAIRFCYSQHKQNKYSVHPFNSLVANEGYGLDATNCNQKYSRFKVDLSVNSTTLHLPDNITPDNRIINACRRYHSLHLRLYSKIRKLLNV
ncbi:MAG: hypothetical protein HDR82_05925 [Bacteroides sp.]|nr:hypothetical protein [Bacteroides sp.]